MIACRKKNDPVKPTVPNDGYLIKTATFVSNSPYILSMTFNYNNKYQLTSVGMGNEKGLYASNQQHYDEQGRIIYNNGFRGDNITPVSYDSIVWAGQKSMRYTRWISAGPTVYDTAQYEYNNTGLPIFWSRPIVDLEYIYENGDLVKRITTKFAGRDNIFSKSEATFEYDSMPNPFYWLFLHNPYVSELSERADYFMLPSKHNITKMSINYLSGGDPAYITEMLFENKYNATTHLLEEQTLKYKTLPGDTVRSSTVFTYIKL
ncbi:MAG: hypothetical protein J7623_03145 [Chitinophaga sp.]|nr:hypothetical protein [Chitinophaga sp.]